MALAFHITAVTAAGPVHGIVHDGVFYAEANQQNLSALVDHIDEVVLWHPVGPDMSIAIPFPFGRQDQRCTIVAQSLSDIGNLLDARRLA